MAEEKRLDFAVIGAQKSATSWLYYCLRDHPAVVVARNKDEREYLGGAVASRHGLGWFFDRFPPAAPGQVVGDVSVDYMFDPGAVDALHAVNPGLRVVAALREPISRAVSSYMWALRQAQVHDFDLSDGLARALDLVEGGRAETDPILAETLTRAYYGEQIRRYVDRFGPENVHVTLYEEIKRSPLDALSGLYGFLGIDPGFEPPSLHYPAKKTVYHPAVIHLERWATRSLNARRIIERVKIAALKVLPPVQRPELRPEVEARLRAHFAPRVAETVEVLRRLPEDRSPARAVEAEWS